ncbi:RIP metalloprotease RseP [Syntrophotalea acetylenivorans]|uniref:Zinc metalloprotease n=1 Tax=Syntrophotalea acetylenivorans TaxID=1842532 RepID=A0A1L3GMW4_9BACT|nr:RIP metalloprotease RseP [Syntrophotalea acetylenivorans]APG27241.1 RIP metalloprotease RseP [Syntrophotalea acetylenivorans]
MVTIIAGIIMLGILVFIHELGHFAVAKLAGVKVLKFSLGFGPRVVSRQWGETEYMICAVPLGGYVQMLGEGVQENEEDQPLSEEERSRSFAEKSVSRRLAIVAAGPFMNLALPFVVLPLAFLVGINLPVFLDQPACVGYVLPQSPAEEAGLLSGDCIVAVGDQAISSWIDADKALLAQAGQPTVFDVQRDGAYHAISVAADDSSAEGLQALGLAPYQDAVVGALSPGMPAQKSGLQVGDRILSIDGENVASWYDLKTIIQQAEEGTQNFLVERSGQQLEIPIAPIRSDGDGEYLVGIAPQVETVFKRFAFKEAFAKGAARSCDLIELTLVFIQKLVLGKVSSRNIGGPITVVQVAGQAAQTDLASIFSILAFLSIQLGILNLFPIPILDGGHLLFGFFELIFRRPLPLRVREIAQQVGLLFIVLLMALAFYNDILRIFNGGQ